jgi:hypothetical protein
MCVISSLALLFIFDVSLALKYQASSVSRRSPLRFSIAVTALNVKLQVSSNLIIEQGR